MIRFFELLFDVYGVGPDMDRAGKFKVALGRFLPPDELENSRYFAVIGAKVKDELFRNSSPLGALVRIGGSRFRVVGANTLIPEGKVFPDRVLIVGSPRKVVRELSDQDVANLQKSAEHYVANAQRYRDTLQPL